MPELAWNWHRLLGDLTLRLVYCRKSKFKVFIIVSIEKYEPFSVQNCIIELCHDGTHFELAYNSQIYVPLENFENWIDISSHIF